ncbi:MAG: class I SAM-dependent methyltransferase [Planctomycetes bacterium]|nr:class I SAM-dependent methyltransferase [Planctomycetota bacterium]
MISCLGCGATLPKPFLDLGTMPLANALVRPEDAAKPEPTHPLAVALCSSCRLVQLTHRVPPEELFADYPYFSAFSESFLAHARRMTDALCVRFSPRRVLEIASNDGYLLQYFAQRGVSVLGVEPARNVARAAEERGVPTLTRFFGPDAVGEILERFGPADLVIGNNVLAHVPAINGFLDATRRCLGPSGVAVFEFPHLLELLARIEFDTVYHEHVFYYSLSAVKTLAERAGLSLFDVEAHPVHGGSLRVFLSPSARDAEGRVSALLDRERAEGLRSPERYESFGRTVAALREALRSRLRERKDAGKRLAAYGAPAKGNVLLNYCGIGRDLLDFTVDRSPHKQGMFLPGSRLPVRPPAALLEEMPDCTLLLPWNLENEIVAQQREYLDRGGRFLVPIPYPREVAA